MILSGMFKISKSRTRREGAVAVEFALVALPFFVIILAIFEIAVFLTVNSLLEAATMGSGRLVRTGQISETMDKDDFKREICARMSVFSSQCLSRISVDVRPVTAFTDPIVPTPIVDGRFDEDLTTFDRGAARSLMVVRVWYRHPIITPFLRSAMSKTADGESIMHSTSAFRNEPYA